METKMETKIEVRQEGNEFAIFINGEIRRSKKFTCIWYKTQEAAEKMARKLRKELNLRLGS